MNKKLKRALEVAGWITFGYGLSIGLGLFVCLMVIAGPPASRAELCNIRRRIDYIVPSRPIMCWVTEVVYDVRLHQLSVEQGNPG